MPNSYIDNQGRWEQLSEVDYLSVFANAWLAFNAWYRNVYSEGTDRKIINAIKNESNVIRSSLVPLLSSDSEDSEQLRANIGLLHDRLENHYLYSGKGPQKTRISLKDVYLRNNSVTSPLQSEFSGVTYKVTPNGRQLKCEVIGRTNAQIFILTQDRFNIAELEADHGYANNLNRSQQGRFASLYREANPRCVADLTNHDQPVIECGAYEFTCSTEDLFAGLLEVIYLMRCTFFHGELVPCKDASACYEPAYRLVRRFLQAIS